MKDKLLCQGYVRADGSKGIRNKVLVIYTVECCRALSERIARHFQELGQDVEAVGTSSCLDNQADIRRLLRFSTHPNVGAVLAIGHGCEYTKPQKIAEFARQRGRESQWFYQQEAGGSVKGYDKGLEIVRELLKKLEATPREPMYLSELVLAGECGGSDFTSGLAGNALIGRVFDRLVDAGGTAIFEELCEGLGLKEYLAARAATPRVADDIRRAYDKTMEFCVKYGHFSIAPGNMDGGLTTIEEKSMGAMVKSGTRPIRGVLKIAHNIRQLMTCNAILSLLCNAVLGDCTGQIVTMGPIIKNMTETAVEATPEQMYKLRLRNSTFSDAFGTIGSQLIPWHGYMIYFTGLAAAVYPLFTFTPMKIISANYFSMIAVVSMLVLTLTGWDRVFPGFAIPDEKNGVHLKSKSELAQSK